ncbi:polynucleotide adenylyltransferase PcnB [Halioxenophilus sp. WMMB6]|uniref:polynucleotide adenylyltransferase PcnB n=1 Tax=Halioxenophilus sp. WMMB6 TaxID=3073815 RepID=UPI00295F3BB0|nr:polynucleotide adenylyltransferase PcnB [Halioxenophilus sp. WMMB6]
MLKRFINLFTGDSGKRTQTIIPKGKHLLSNKDISHSALKVIDRLNEANFQAYLVGGGVRDLLLGGHPKDFDVATDATPEQVRKLFRNSRIVGRRFRIVHVRYGREIIEVTTFRSHHQHEHVGEGTASRSAEGMLLRDNVYGDIRSDAERRDFTVNALYFHPKSAEILDFTQGAKDIERRLLRIIGDPTTRFKEDPVRMLRAVRFAAKLGFQIEEKTAAPIYKLGGLLDNIPSARLWDECLKLLMAGYSTAVFRQLLERDLFRHLFPGVAEQIAKNDQVVVLIENAMANTDKRIRADKRVTPAFIFAVMLWPEIVERQQKLVDSGVNFSQAAIQAQQQVLQKQLNRVAIPKRFTSTMREIWDLQSQLPRRSGMRAYRTLEHPRFRAAYDFLLLREQSGENHQGLGLWWTEFQFADADTREAMIKALPAAGKGRSGRSRPRRRKPANSNRSTTATPDQSE